MGDKAARANALGQAISYRFKRDAKGWRVFATTELPEVEITTDRRRGAIGVDLNADHLAVADTDASGNCINAWRVPLVTYGKSQRQSEALIGDAVASVVEYAQGGRQAHRHREAGLPPEEGCPGGRVPPVLPDAVQFHCYGKIKAYFISRGYRQGVEVHQVNPAYSSVIGRVKFMERYGLTVHQAAGLVLARRLLGCSERIPRRWVCPVGNGVQVAFTVPVRKRVKHVWTYWGVISGQLRPALAAQHRLGRPNPVRAVRRVEARGVAAERGSARCFRARLPGGAALNCWGGGAAQTAYSGTADGSLVTKVNLLHNGFIIVAQLPQVQAWHVSPSLCWSPP